MLTNAIIINKSVLKQKRVTLENFSKDFLSAGLQVYSSSLYKAKIDYGATITGNMLCKSHLLFLF